MRSTYILKLNDYTTTFTYYLVDITTATLNYSNINNNTGFGNVAGKIAWFLGTTGTGLNVLNNTSN